MRARGERGSATVEVVLLTPVFVALLALVVLTGRVGARRADVEGVAHRAARTLTLSRDPGRAEPAVQADAATSLTEGSPTCRQMEWRVAYTPEAVTVEVSCLVDLDDTAMLPLPTSLTVTGRATEVIDRYREDP